MNKHKYRLKDPEKKCRYCDETLPSGKWFYCTSACGDRYRNKIKKPFKTYQ